MRVREKETGKLLHVNDSYGARLIEQGKATAAENRQNAKEKTARRNAPAKDESEA